MMRDNGDLFCKSCRRAPLTHALMQKFAWIVANNKQTDRPKSAAVQTHQGLGTYQRTACRDLVAEAVNQISNDRNKNGKLPDSMADATYVTACLSTTFSAVSFQTFCAITLKQKLVHFAGYSWDCQWCILY